MFKRWTKSIVALTAATALLLAGCGSDSANTVGDGADKPITIGVVGASQEQWTIYKQKAEAAGIKVEIKDFTDYTTENPAVKDGSLDSNQFQHILYLARYNKDQNADLVPIASTAIYPLGLYSKKHTKLEDIPQGGQIAVPNDETNKSRALHVLQQAGLLKLKDGTGVVAAEEDIDQAASKVKVSPMDAQQTVTSLSSIDGAVVNNDFVNDAGLDPKTALYADDASSKAAEPYINIFVVRKADAENVQLKKLAELFADKDVQAALQKDSGNSAVLVTKTPAELQQILADVTASLK
ncbi:MetQ/NlpA family ABC transporter substrate-binding protein [Propionibacteriaceae bacterium G1746]|uniref:MetQ/NlpA family ABC transporter substrate-binding protein n=1 Tax=Aestuariimicrobium sp. G57 TaxID=3418485 RepID=UPI003C175632